MAYDWGDDDDGDNFDRAPFDQVWNDNAEINFDQWQDHGYDDNEMRDQHLNFLEEMAGFDQMDHGDQLQAWTDYIDAFVNGDGDRDTFFEDMGYDAADFDWDGWREIMGY
jgi:hypothetical protein